MNSKRLKMFTRRNSKPNELVAKLVTVIKAPCIFCGRQVDDEIVYGKLYVIGDIHCHYFCALLASCLVQKGKDEEGLFGFLYKDILAEVVRSKKHKCSYCGRGGATLGCSLQQCRKQFHLPCGRERNAISLFYGTYKSFCQKHAPKQKLTGDIELKVEGRRKNLRKNKTINGENVTEESQTMDGESSVCAICYEEVLAMPTLETFWPPCCARDAWFHRSCLQRMALSAGVHYLKCPLCNDKENFHKAVLNQGFYIPDRDAAWELEQNAFAEIYERNLSCGADECQCPMGRNHDTDHGAWEIRACLLCGSTGAHVKCLPNELDVAYVCTICRPAAPEDLDKLAKTVETVVLREESHSAVQSRRGPVMPGRMSLRRTKRQLVKATTSSSGGQETDTLNCDESSNLVASRRDLNLKTPRRPQHTSEQTSIVTIDNNKLFSPIKLLEQGFRETITRTGLHFDVDEQILEDMRKRFKKPRPLSEKRKIVNDIISGVFNDIFQETKRKQPVKEWCSPKKISEVIEEDNMEIDDSRTQELESSVVSDISSDDTRVLLVDENRETSQIAIPKSDHDHIKCDVNIDIESSSALEKVDFSQPVLNIPENVDTENGTVLKVEENCETANLDEVNYGQEEKATIPVDIDTASLLKENVGKIDENDLATSSKIDEYSDDTSSTFQLPQEFIAEGSDDSSDDRAVFKSPNKLKTFDIQIDSSLEISENDQAVNVDIVKMDSNIEDPSNVIAESLFKNNKCALNVNTDSLSDDKTNIDLECFKNYYLNEVEKDFKCNDSGDVLNSVASFNNNKKTKTSKNRGVKRRKKRKDISGKKRKVLIGEVEKDSKSELEKLKFTSDQECKKRSKNPKKKINLATKDLNKAVERKWQGKKQQLKFNISEINTKLFHGSNKHSLTQYILNPTYNSFSEIIMKPEREVSARKRKYVRNGKVSDALVQTSMTKFFTMKSP